VAHLSRVLHGLTPNPAQSVLPATPVTLRPEIRVTIRQGGGLEVEKINTVAAALSVDKTLWQANNAANRDFQMRADRANALIRALQMRAKTVLRVAGAIVEIQHEFFSGPGQGGDLRPLTRKFLAEKLSLHPSTVTRATRNKSLECASGVYPLGFFFPSGIHRCNDGEQTSSRSVQQAIARLIATETPGAILSDTKITALLRENGTNIARRTVAKYRQSLKIPSSAQRRKSKPFL